jgi:hypothetical protein
MRVLTYSVTIAWLIGSYPAPAQSPPVDQRVIFPHSDDAMARALADPKIPADVKQQLFALFDSRLKPQLVEDKAGNQWLYRQGQAPIIIQKQIR